jgi:hypothetical protein
MSTVLKLVNTLARAESGCSNILINQEDESIGAVDDNDDETDGRRQRRPVTDILQFTGVVTDIVELLLLCSLSRGEERCGTFGCFGDCFVGIHSSDMRSTRTFTFGRHLLQQSVVGSAHR